jgi:SulP family sulfate permease
MKAISMFSNFRTNAKSGITVALVSLPLYIPVALVSGVTPVQGIITGVWAGLIGALFGGSSYNIIGMTGALSGFVATYALTNGIDHVAYLTLWVGFFIILAYFLRLERYLVLIPSSVIHGFTVGIAGIIGLSQIRHAVGVANGSLYAISEWSMVALITFIGFLAVLLFLRFIKFPIPGVILITPISLLLGWASTEYLIPVSLETLGSRYGTITPKLFDIHLIFDKPPLVPALVIAIVAILETLLSAKIADKMSHTKHDARKEVFGLGLANVASGIMGGIPAAAALARTAFNVKAGATSKYSAVMSSVTIAVISLGFLTYFAYLPMAVIAAVLVSVSIGMIEREHFIRLYRYDKASFAIALIVAFITMYEDPIIGLLVGTVIALLLLIHKLLPGSYYHYVTDGIMVYSIKGELVYLNSDTHRAHFEKATHSYSHVILKLRDLAVIDLDGVEGFDHIIQNAHKHHKKVALIGVSSTIYPLLAAASSEFPKLEKQGLVCAKTHEAVARLKN